MGEFKRFRGGAGWRELPDGRLELEHGVELASDALERYVEVDDNRCARTKGRPLTALKLIEEHGEAIERSARAHGIPEQIIAGVLLTESGRVKGSYSRDVISLREEPGFVSWQETPRRGSAGLMQTLLTTARSMAARHNLELYDPMGNPRRLGVGDLIVPELSIWLGAAYLAYLRDEDDEKPGLDPILLTAGYNAGSVKPSEKNDYNLRVHGGNDRIVKHAAYANDYLAAKRGA